MNQIHRIVVLCALMVPCVINLCAEEWESLKGVTSVAVVIEDLDSGDLQTSLTEDGLRSVVEQILRGNSIRVVNSVTEADNYVYVRITIVDGDGGQAGHVNVEFRQPAKVEHNSHIDFLSTWSRDITLSFSSDIELNCTRGLVELVNQLKNDYLKANPK